jgi:hypothetical protein
MSSDSDREYDHLSQIFDDSTLSDHDWKMNDEDLIEVYKTAMNELIKIERDKIKNAQPKSAKESRDKLEIIFEDAQDWKFQKWLGGVKDERNE